eukprot:gi/632963177/ref/XP_007897736.1/ PREDICTED: TBC1 domain family member 30-like [Callorhinchus milii]
MNQYQVPVVNLNTARHAGRCLRKRKSSLGTVISNVLQKRKYISRSAPRLLCTLQSGADPQMKLNIEYLPDQNGFQQWFETSRTLVWLPAGIPTQWRHRVWLTLADHYLQSISVDWAKSKELCLNGRGDLDENALGVQIDKDLRQSSCEVSWGPDVESSRSVVKRLLLAYARWNKSVGYCRAFIEPVALILEVMGRDEGDTLKVLIYLLERVLPENYFAPDLSALTVDIAVFHELFNRKLPELAKHLDGLYRAAGKDHDGRRVLPLTSVVTMQWFLTLFTSCLPKETFLRVWDAFLFDGSEVLLRVALATWAHLAEWIKKCQSPDEVVKRLSQTSLETKLADSSKLMQTAYSMASFPASQVAELREKYSTASLTTASSCQLKESQCVRKAQRGVCVLTSTLGCRPAYIAQDQQDTGSDGSCSHGTPLRSRKSKVINHLLGGKKVKNSSKSNRVHHTSTPKISQRTQRDQKNKLSVPWCSQKRAPHKSLARNLKTKSGYGDTVGLLDDQTDGTKTEHVKDKDPVQRAGVKNSNASQTHWAVQTSYNEQLEVLLFEKEVDSLVEVENMLKALQVGEERPPITAESSSKLITRGCFAGLKRDQSTANSIAVLSNMKVNHSTCTALKKVSRNKEFGITWTIQ